MSALNDLYVDGEIAGWIGYYEGRICTFMFDKESVDIFLENTKPCGQVRPVFTTPKIPKRECVDFCRLHEVNQELLKTMRQLACLGNGDKYGNSDGNIIARAAIAKAEVTK